FIDISATEIYTLSLHDALPICVPHNIFDEDGERLLKPSDGRLRFGRFQTASFGRDGALSSFKANIRGVLRDGLDGADSVLRMPRSEEHTSELQSLAYLVCRLLL